MTKHCATCSKRLWHSNKTGYCADHFRESESFRANHRAGLRRHFSDPIKLLEARERMKRNRSTENAKESRRACAIRIGLHKLGHAAITPEAIAKRGKSIQRTRLAHVPRDQWDTYRDLVANCHVSKEDALAMVLEKQDLEMARFRREIGAVG